jgi:hypothetical protein
MNAKPVATRILCMVLFGFCLLGCSFARLAQSAPAPAAIATSTPAPVALDAPLSSDPLFTASNAVIALAAGQNDDVYAVVYQTGDVVKIKPDGKSTTLYSGLKSCGFGAFAAIAALPGGGLAAYDCPDNKHAQLIKIDASGAKTTLASLDESNNLMSLTADPSGQIYLGYWTSGNANLSVDFNPNHISAAEAFDGYVARLGTGGVLDRVYHGGLPMSLAADADRLVVATWGQAGAFSAEQKEYSICAPTNMFWIVLSDQVQVNKISGGPADSTPLGGLNAVSAVAAGPGGLLFAAGMGKAGQGACGIYYTRPGQAPAKLSFSANGVDKNILALAATRSALYWADTDGHIYRARLTESK